MDSDGIAAEEGLPPQGDLADMTVRGSPLSLSLMGAKRTWLFALHMSAFDPKRTRTLRCNRANTSFSVGGQIPARHSP